MAELAAEVVTNPPPEIRAAQRFLAALRTPGEVEFLELVAELEAGKVKREA